MIDLSILNDYRTEPDDFIIGLIKNEYNTYGLEHTIEYKFKSIDATRIINGFRPSQTIGFSYMADITFLLYLIEHYVDDVNKQDEYYTRVINQHKANLEFEKENPPIWYGGKKEKRKFEKTYKDKSPKRKVKQEVIEFENMPKKQSAAERKLAAKVAKINSLSFKIKSI